MTNGSPNRSTLSTIIVILVVGIAVILGYAIMHAPDNRSVGEKLDDAVEELQDRTPAEKAGDAIEDMGDKIQRSTHE